MKKNILPFIYKIFAFSFLFKILFITSSLEVNAEDNFDVWLSSYKKFALRKGVSQETLDIAFKNVKFLHQVIKYDRKQPEFFEDTITYVNKRANLSRSNKAKKLLNEKADLFTDVENKFFSGSSITCCGRINFDASYFKFKWFNAI